LAVLAEARLTDRAVAHGCACPAARWRRSGGPRVGTHRHDQAAGGRGLRAPAGIRWLPALPTLRHVVRVRQRTCSFPGCRRPAARCDQDHTVPHDQGGRTCECNLAPLCRRHHRAKQAQGWRLDQPEPGVMVWTLPHGRSYRVQPPPTREMAPDRTRSA